MKHTDKLSVEEITILAAEMLESIPENLSLSSWTLEFPSSSGPRKGRIARQAFTIFNIYAFNDKNTSKKIKYCAGVWKEWDGTINEEW